MTNNTPAGLKNNSSLFGVIYVTNSAMQIVEYLASDGSSPFADWFMSLNPPAAARVTTALTRIELGNLSNAKSVGAGVFEYRIDWGPGYRLYFGRDGEVLVILLGGGTKRRQQRDIAEARDRWHNYKRRKKEK